MNVLEGEIMGARKYRCLMKNGEPIFSGGSAILPEATNRLHALVCLWLSIFGGRGCGIAGRIQLGQ